MIQERNRQTIESKPETGHGHAGTEGRAASRSAKSGPRRRAKRVSVLALAAAALLLVLAACGASEKSKTASSASPSPAASSGASPAAAAAGEPKLPSVLHYGFIGLNKLNLPRGAEGWGLYKGIIQEALAPYGVTKIESTAFPNGPDQSEALMSGRLDFGSLGDTPAILARSTGAKTRLISQNQIDLLSYLIAKKNGPASVQDLKGKTIAVQKGSYMHRYLVGLLKSEGVTGYKLVHMLSADGEAALARGDVDAMTNSGADALRLIDEGYPLLDDTTKHPELYGTSVTVATEDFLAKYPDFPKLWNEARLKALDDLKQHPDDYYAFLAQISNTTPEIAKKVYPIESIEEQPFTDEGLKLLDGTKQFLIDEKIATKNFELKDWQLAY
ncbi:ABC transporter substrate-binding protein [Cohnella zeiphila]|uniref:ABC transporter substrate-binding protein n=1 Tax=Cohnella zeiphila TaxID=2761120 RepID=A0A7X0SQ52_9BACL|nr:ABC transporter substrate-binding protein [Cohnella zeiphila]MBB6734097.1 ABC transporter substrate-binding protein [Cohnella zeiphila]